MRVSVWLCACVLPQMRMFVALSLQAVLRGRIARKNTLTIKQAELRKRFSTPNRENLEVVSVHARVCVCACSIE